MVLRADRPSWFVQQLGEPLAPKRELEAMELDFTMDDLSVGAARLHCFCSRALVLYDVFVETAASGITMINGVSG